MKASSIGQVTMALVHRSMMLIAAASMVLLLMSCGSDEEPVSAPTTDSVAITAGTDAATTVGDSGEPMTVEGIVQAVQARLDAEFGVTEHPEGVTGPIELQCDDSGPINPGAVFACVGMPRTEPGFPLDPVGVVFYVIDGTGRTYSVQGTDVPDSTAAVRALHDAVPSGLFCRDLAADETGSNFFSGAGQLPVDRYFWSLVYWSLEGQPDRMDADGNGVPCETLFDPSVVATVLAGN